MSPRHVIVLRYSPFIVESVDTVLSMEGYTVLPAATFGDARALISALGEGLVAVIAHCDMPSQPNAGKGRRSRCSFPAPHAIPYTDLDRLDRPGILSFCGAVEGHESRNH